MVLVPDHMVTICPMSLAGHGERGCVGKRCMWFITVSTQDGKQQVQGGCAIPMLVPLVADIQQRFSGMAVEVKKHGT